MFTARAEIGISGSDGERDVFETKEGVPFTSGGRLRGPNGAALSLECGSSGAVLKTAEVELLRISAPGCSGAARFDGTVEHRGQLLERGLHALLRLATA